MGLRPARTCREIKKVAWARFSRKKPRKSFVKALPQNQVQVYHMGNPNLEYEFDIDLVAENEVQIRDNALESARQAVNKYLEKNIAQGYYFRVCVFPHNIIRENKMILGAGADRLQKGMRKAFGRPTDRGAIIHPNQTIFKIKTMEKSIKFIKEAYRRAKSKLPGKFMVRISKVK